MEEKIAELKKTIEEMRIEIESLKEWKESKETQQISLPLDEASKTIINAI